MKHIPVLLHEAIEGLNLKEGDVCIDATFGGGGHSREICRQIGHKGKLVALDADSYALGRLDEILSDEPCQKIAVLGNFRRIEELAEKNSISQADGVLMDLGTSAGSIENSGRGFTFLKDEPLLMTYKAEPEPGDLTAKEILNEWQEENLADIIYGFGGEKFSRKIAKAIVGYRQTKQIETTGQLVSIVESAVPVWYKHRRIHPATKTFQALRIAVNEELPALKEGLAGGWKLLKPKGRMAVITFHDLEARIVKRFFTKKKQLGEGKLISKRAIKPQYTEVKANPRSRSAQLRIIEKVK